MAPTEFDIISQLKTAIDSNQPQQVNQILAANKGSKALSDALNAPDAISMTAPDTNQTYKLPVLAYAASKSNWFSNKHIVEALMGAGADPNMKGENTSWTALSIAEYYHKLNPQQGREVLDALRSKKAPSNSVLRSKDSQESFASKVRTLVGNSFGSGDSQKKESKKMSAWQWAAAAGAALVLGPVGVGVLAGSWATKGKKTGSKIVGALTGMGCAAIGAAIGTAIIPIPVLGTLIGAAIGAAISVPVTKKVVNKVEEKFTKKTPTPSSGYSHVPQKQHQNHQGIVPHAPSLTPTQTPPPQHQSSKQNSGQQGH